MNAFCFIFAMCDQYHCYHDNETVAIGHSKMFRQTFSSKFILGWNLHDSKSDLLFIYHLWVNTESSAILPTAPLLE